MQVNSVLTRLKHKRGEGKLVESFEVGSRRRSARFPQSPPLVLRQITVEASVSMGMSSKHDSLKDSKDNISFLQQENMELKSLLETAEEEK